MNRISMLRRSNLLLRSALGATLAMATVAGPAYAADKAPQAPKIKLSSKYQPLAVSLNKAIETAKTRPDVVAAQKKVTDATAAAQQARGPAREQAMAARNAAIAELGNTLSAEKGMLEASFAGVASPDDRFTAGQLAVSLGGLAQDPAMQRRGLQAMVESGKASPAEAARFQFFIGSISFDMRDYPTARTALEAAVAAGFHDNDADALLAEAYIADNQAATGLAKLQQAIDYRNGTANPAPASWYRRGLGASYKAQLLDQAVGFSLGLVKAYPSTENWSGAITVVREIGKYANQETLDLMRLMDRTKSYAEERDYIEYIQASDPRRLPGETLRVIEAGLAAGKLRATDTFVTDARTQANDRVAADKASLAGLERDARAANATGATVAGAADAFLSYGQPAKAEELYKIALGKPGIDTARALTRLGIAQADQGKYAEAQATLAKVDGPRKYIAQLWSLYAAQQAAKPAG